MVARLRSRFSSRFSPVVRARVSRFALIGGGMLAPLAARADGGGGIDYATAGNAVGSALTSNLTAILPAVGGILAMSLGVSFFFKLVKRASK